MSKLDRVILWGALAAFGVWLFKKQCAGSAATRGIHASTAQPYRLGTGTLGGADAYTDAFPEDGLGGVDPGR